MNTSVPEGVATARAEIGASTVERAGASEVDSTNGSAVAGMALTKPLAIRAIAASAAGTIARPLRIPITV